MMSSEESISSDIENDFDSQNSKSKYNDYMKNYMREYRRKQKIQQEENRHCCCICNKLCKDTEVESLIKKAIGTLIKIINDNSSIISEERITRIYDCRDDVFKYAELIIETVEELRNIHLNQ